MFVRKKHNKSGSTSIQILQKVGRKNQVVRTIGCSSDPQEIERLYQQGKEESLRFYGPTLFDPVSTADLRNITNDGIRIIGPEKIFGALYHRIGYQILDDSLLRSLVISRLTHPGSKLKLSQYLSSSNQSPISVYSIYRFMDKISSQYKDQIEQLSFNYTLSILQNKISVVFYDMTTLYFESSQPDELRIPGFSKEGKHQHPQIYIGLLVGSNGYPIGYDIFEGNIYEGHTLIPTIQRFEKQFGIERPIIVADSGLLNKDNINILKENNYQFILGVRVKSENRLIAEDVKNKQWHDGMIVEYNKFDSTGLIVQYSDSRAEKDAFNRERGLRKLEKLVKSGRLTKANINNRGYNKYLKMDGDIRIQIDYQRYHQDAAMDGIKGYITNTGLPAKDVIGNYRELWHIERAFRISKTDLQIRPIYHRLRNRIEAHVCISFMAYLVYKEFERLLQINNLNISLTIAIEQINKMFEIIIPDNNGGTIPFRPTNNPIQQKIEEIIKLS
jgi:transposase